MSSNIERAAARWSEQAVQFEGRNLGTSWWEAGPEVHRYINRRITDNPDRDWIEDTLQRYFSGRLPLARALSLGCGAGFLERSLARLGAFAQCDAYDVADGAVNKAREVAAAEGWHHINYFVTDINRIELPHAVYDAVWVHSAMHHFDALEHVCQQIAQALKPDGLLILQEYVGPNRFQFPERQQEIANLCLRLVPERYRQLMPATVAQTTGLGELAANPRHLVTRLLDKLRDGSLLGTIKRRVEFYRRQGADRRPLRSAVNFPTERSVMALDPSEAVRSAEIVPVLRQHFDIIAKRDWGGNILQYLLAGIAGNFADGQPISERLLLMLINIEETLLDAGEFESDFAYIVARPKPASAGEAASATWQTDVVSRP